MPDQKEPEVCCTSDDEDYEALVGFDEEEARAQLLRYKNTTKISMTAELQEEMGLLVGENISSEKPWKQIRKEILEDYLPDGIPALEDLKEKLHDLEPNQLVLFGYIPQLSEDMRDVFMVFENEKAAKEASDLIHLLEILDRKRAKNLIVKHPKMYVSAGSEREVDVQKAEREENIFHVEVQSKYPLRDVERVLSLRLVEDARDGYVELVPGRKKIETVFKRRNNMAIQCGAILCHRTQQTDPTFPTNAWAQYFYEILEEEGFKPKSVDKGPLGVSGESKQPTSEVTPEPLVISDRVKGLIDTLEFNKIDMYRDDYMHIAKKGVEKYQSSYLEETFCFADMSKTCGRLVSSASWHPEYSGVVAVAYTFEAISTYIQADQEPKAVQRTILEKNPVIIWSFDDTLKPKLELTAMREVLSLSFCPYDPNLLIGGLVSGDVVLWDLADRIRRVETEEVLTPEEANNRQMTREFLNWMKADDTDQIIVPAATSSGQDSHLEPITCIKWLPRNFFCTNGGKIKDAPEKNRRFFVTCSFDGSICFWDLDWSPSEEEIKKNTIDRKFKVPKELEEIQSPYKKLDLIFRPIYRLEIGKPICQFIMEEIKINYKPLSITGKRDITTRVLHKIEPQFKDSFLKAMVIGTTFGEVFEGAWEGFDFSQGATVNQEKMTLEYFVAVHDDPIIALEENKFIPELLISAGGTVFAVWRRGFLQTALFWRSRDAKITACQWSNDRPAVFFVTLNNGTLEMWDILARTNKPCLTESLGGNILTIITQHRLTLPRSVLAIGDHNSSLRIFLIPSAFVRQVKNETEEVRKFIAQIEQIKVDQDMWKHSWIEKNPDLIEARKQAAEELRPEYTRMLAEREKEDSKPKLQIETKKPKKFQKSHKYLSDQLEKKWNELNYDRLLRILMERKRVNPELLEKLTKPEKDRQKYQAVKQEAIKASFAKVYDELTEIRIRLIPQEIIDDSKDKLIEVATEEGLHDMKDYYGVLDDSMKLVNDAVANIHIFTMSEILERGRQRREIIDRSLGGNPAQLDAYLKDKESRRAERMRKSSLSVTSARENTRSVTFGGESAIEETL